jgi:hypothetical protein
VAAEIEVYKGQSQSYFGSFSLEYLILQALTEGIDQPLLGLLRSAVNARATRLHLELVKGDPDDDDGWETGRVRLVNADTTGGHIRVSAWSDGKLTHKRTFPARDLFDKMLVPLLLRIDPHERHWAYALRASVRRRGGRDGGAVLEEQNIRPTPDVIGGIDVDLGHRPRSVPFEVRQVPSPRTDTVDAERLGLDPARLAPVNVLLHKRIDRLLRRDLPFSAQIEEGGFLLGRIRMAEDDAQVLFAEITDVRPAARSGASAVHFTFTADSFHEVNGLISKEQGEELVGWYHSHLFSADVEMGTGIGLSSTDVQTHLSTFRRPGQVAGLLNITDKERALRFYGRDGDVIEECPLWIYDERGRYRIAGSRLGDG